MPYASKSNDQIVKENQERCLSQLVSTKHQNTFDFPISFLILTHETNLKQPDLLTLKFELP